MMGFGGIIWIVLLIPIVIWFLNRNGNNSTILSTKSNDDSLNILKKRYANGEISKEEFIKIKNDLLSN